MTPGAALRNLEPMEFQHREPVGVVFDFDGTLADTRHSILSTYAETFRRLGRPHPGEDRVAATIGVPLHIAFRSVTDMTEEESLEACDVYREAFANRELDEVRLFHGVDEVLDRLHERGVPLAIASSRSHHSLRRLIEHLGLAGRFTAVAGREDARREKPYPDMLLGVSHRLGIDAGDLLMVGDTTFDIHMGHNAGAPTCAVTYGNHSREELAGANPTFMVDSPRELGGALASAR